MRITAFNRTIWNVPIPFSLPSEAAVRKIALEILATAPIAVVAYALPLATIACNVIFFMASTVIADTNEEEIRKQMASGVDFNKCVRMLKCIEIIQKIHHFSLKAILVSLSAVSLSTGMACLPFIVFGIEKPLEKQQQAISMQKQDYLNAQDLHYVQLAYPTISKKELYEKCLLEQKIKPIKTQYVQKQKEYIALAWEHMLQTGKFNQEQGIDADWDIFEPLCRIAITSELSHPLFLQGKECPPSLIHRHEALLQVQSVWKALSLEDQKKVQEMILDEKAPKVAPLKDVYLKVCSAAAPLLQDQDLFADPLIKGAETYCIKNRLAKKFVALQMVKLKRFRNELFFKAS